MAKLIHVVAVGAVVGGILGCDGGGGGSSGGGGARIRRR
jgi:hypothetical protein